MFTVQWIVYTVPYGNRYVSTSSLSDASTNGALPASPAAGPTKSVAFFNCSRVTLGRQAVLAARTSRTGPGKNREPSRRTWEVQA